MRVRLTVVQRIVDAFGGYVAGRQLEEPSSVVGEGGHCWLQFAKVQLGLILCF
jgi:hypothetical protein